MCASSPVVAAAPSLRVVASGLLAPESPKPLADGSVLVCEMGRGALSRVLPSGQVIMVAMLGGSPNGVAIGPDGAAYVMRNPGTKWIRTGSSLAPAGPLDTLAQAAVVRVDLKSGATRVLYTETEGVALKAPNDLVFDRRGGFWFTDLAGNAVLWAKPDGSEIRKVFSLPRPNGIVLSPDGTRLFCVSANTICVVRTVGPGRVATDATGAAKIELFCKTDFSSFDSMAAQSDGGLAAGTIFSWPPPGPDIGAQAAIVRFGADGTLVDTVKIDDPLVTSVGFGGRNLRTAFATLTSTGRLVAMDWPVSGLQLANQ